jgi:PleD family two-component response regulator
LRHGDLAAAGHSDARGTTALITTPRSPQASANTNTPRRRVLVAEDNERLAAMVATALAHAGYDVVVAHAATTRPRSRSSSTSTRCLPIC